MKQSKVIIVTPNIPAKLMLCFIPVDFFAQTSNFILCRNTEVINIEPIINNTGLNSPKNLWKTVGFHSCRTNVNINIVMETSMIGNFIFYSLTSHSLSNGGFQDYLCTFFL